MDTKIIMELDSFEKITTIKVPEEYKITTICNEHDESNWEKLITKVFGFECDINRNLKNEDIYSPQRVFLLKKDNKVIATAAAWYREEFGVDAGYLHMVAVDENYRGKGLSKYVVNEAILYMIGEGRSKIILKTDNFRKVAIKLYSDLGFKQIN